jgi:hypothetical protein
LVCDVAKTLHEGDAPWEQWQAQLRRKGVDEHTQAGVRRIYYCTKKGPSRLLDPPYPISTRVAFGLHMLFPKLEIFTETAGDYLGTQYIGGFLDDVKLPKGRYQIINDDNGPVWHLTTNRSVFFDNSRSLSSVISGVYENLADDGVLICSRVPGGGISQLRQDVEMFHLPSWDPRRSMWRMGQDGEKPTIVPDKADIIVVGEGAEPQFILAKDKSPIASHLRKRLNLDDGQGGIFEVKDPLALLNAS